MEIIRIYLAGGCKNEPDEGKLWRQKAVQIFNQAANDKYFRVKIINPTDYFSYSEAKHQSDKQIKEYYMDQIRNARLVLANLDNSVNSIGTGQELQHAVDNGVPVIGFATDDSTVYPWLKTDCQCVFPSMLQAIDYIVDYYLV